jgi:hypothetical protein
MCHSVKRMVVVAMVVSASMLSFGLAAANADMVNGSFELPALDPNGYRAGPPDGWSTYSGRAYVINGSNASGDGMFGPADGSQFTEYTGYLWQNTGVPLQNGYTYAVSCQFNPGSLGMSSARIDLNAAPDSNPASDGPTFASQLYSGLTASVWTGETLSATYTGDPGKYLALWVRMDDGTLDGGLDAVTLTVTSPSPEPSTIVLLVTGVLGLLAYAWRKRR